MLSIKKYLWLGALFFVTACQKETDDIEPEISDKMNVSYGSDPKQKMDVYLPSNGSTSSTKVIILIHGGGWREGDKSDFNPYVTGLKQRLPGYAIFNVNYRLAGPSVNLFPSQENDIKTAIEFIYNKRNEYKISDKFVLLGASAGAHLALLHGFKYTSPVKPKAIVSFFGPTDLKVLFNSNLPAAFLLTQVTGGTPTANAAVYDQSSPATFVTAQSPPTILLQGGADPLVPPAQSELLKNLLTNAGVVNQYVFYPNESHGWIGPNLDDSFDKITQFLTTHVN
jgi:acetyl esterase/lipase